VGSAKSVPRDVTLNLFFHPVRSVGHVMHSGVSGAQNFDALFFMLRWAQYRFDKKYDGTH
jgi:hypothetical protein